MNDNQGKRAFLQRIALKHLFMFLKSHDAYAKWYYCANHYHDEIFNIKNFFKKQHDSQEVVVEDLLRFSPFSWIHIPSLLNFDDYWCNLDDKWLDYCTKILLPILRNNGLDELPDGNGT